MRVTEMSENTVTVPHPIPRRLGTILQRNAILHLDGSEQLRETPWPREIAVAYLQGTAGKQPLSWLVCPERFWPSSDGHPVSSPGPGEGLPPVQVASELAEALRGYAVYTDTHLVTARWLRGLFGAAGLGARLPFPVRDFFSLAHRTQPDRREIQIAERSTLSLPPLTWRASGQAARHAQFVRALVGLAAGRQTSAETSGVVPSE